MRDEETSRFVPLLTQERGKANSTDPIPISQSLFRKVVKERSAVLAANAAEDLGRTESILGANILSSMGVPLWIVVPLGMAACVATVWFSGKRPDQTTDGPSDTALKQKQPAPKQA